MAGAEGGVQPKQIYLARRNPALAPERFRESWRAHGRLAMGMPLWRHMVRYTQGDTLELPARARERLPGFDDSQDGISTLLYRSVESLVAEEGDPEMPVLLADEARIFAALVIHTSMFASESVDRAGGATGAKLSLFAVRAAGVGERQFASAWDRQAEAVLSSPAGELVTAYRRNARIEVPGVSDSPSSIGHFDALTEIGFAAAEDLVAALEDDRFAAALRELDPVSDGGACRTVASGELLLYQDSVSI